MGYAAISLAVRLGAREIRLYGYDYSYPEGKSHARDSYLYPIYRSGQTRLVPLETHMALPLFSSPKTHRRRADGRLIYSTDQMQRYQRALNGLRTATPASIIDTHEDGSEKKGATPQRAIEDAQRFAAAPARRHWRSVLQSILGGISSLPAPFDPVIRYLEGLSGAQRRLWTVMTPIVASFRRNNSEYRGGSAAVLKTAREWTIDRVSGSLHSHIDR